MYCVFSTCLLASIQRSNLCALCWVIFMCIYYNIYIYIYTACTYVYIYIYWLVVSTPLKNMKVSYDYYIFTRKMEKNLFQTISIYRFLHIVMHGDSWDKKPSGFPSKQLIRFFAGTKFSKSWSLPRPVLETLGSWFLWHVPKRKKPSENSANLKTRDICVACSIDWLLVNYSYIITHGG